MTFHAGACSAEKPSEFESTKPSGSKDVASISRAQSSTPAPSPNPTSSCRPISFYKLNVDILREPGEQLNVTGIPAFFLFYKGQLKASFMGVKSEVSLLNWLSTELAKLDK
jgi:Thioredoxin